MADSTVRVVFLADSSGATRAVKGLEGSFGGLGQAAKRAGVLITAGIVGGLAAAAKAAITFDRDMRAVNTITKLSEKQFKSLEKQVLGLAKTTGQAPAQLAKGLYDVVSSGFEANDAIKVLSVSAKAASAGMTDTATASKAVVAALNAYKLGAGDARKVSDVLFKTVELGVLTFEELAQNMGDLVPAAAPLGVTLEEVGAGIARITKDGVPAAEAATRVKNTMLALASPSKNLSALLKENGFATGEAAIKARGFAGVLDMVSKATGGTATETSKLFPEIRAARGVLGLTGRNLGEYNRFVREMESAQKGAGATAGAFAEQGKSVAFQWQRAKASLTAAAIPLGELLFPLFREGAEGVGDFAQAVQARMPEIRAQFGELAAGARDVGGALADVGRSREGQIAIAGIASGLAGAKVTGSVLTLVSALRSIHPAVGIVVGGFALLGAAAYAAATSVSGLEQRLNDVKEAMERHRQATAAAKDALLEVRVATTQVEVAQTRLEQAQKNATKAAREFGGQSAQHTAALQVVRQESDNVALANRRLEKANQNAAAAQKLQAAAAREQAAATAQSRKHASELSAAYDRATAAVSAARAPTEGYAEALQRGNANMKAQIIAAYAKEVSGLEKLLGGAAISADVARAAIGNLAGELGRLPTQKEIRIYVRTLRSESSVGALARQEAARGGRAAGGFVPRPLGSVSGIDSVGIRAFPGEMILNPAQQLVLGGPKYLAELFGFSGDRGPGFAAGGVVGGLAVQPGGGARRSRRGPRRPRHTRTLPSSRAARSVLGALADLDIREADLDRAYGQLSRGFDLTREEFLVPRTETDPETGDEVSFDVVDTAAVAQRVGEIDQLLAHRREYLALLDAEKRELALAVKALKVAIDRLRKAIAEQTAAAKAERRQVAQLERQITRENASKDRLVAAERRAKKPNQKRIDSIEKTSAARVARLTRERGVHETYAARHDEQASTLSGQLGEFDSALNDRDSGVVRLQHVIPLDRRDVELDVAELQGQRAEALATRAAPRLPGAKTPPVGDTGGGGGGGFDVDTGGVGVATGISQDVVDALLKQIGQLRLALGLEAVQVPTIASFQRGTLHVNQTGPYELHAGEQVIPAAQRTGGGELPAVDVHVNVADAMGWLKDYIEVTASSRQVSMKVSEEIAREADLRRRGGRY